MKEVIERMKADDPVRGPWRGPKGNKGIVWCDASNLALGVALEIGGRVVEDAARIRKEGDLGHINEVELEAVLRGVNLALKWEIQELEIKADSMTVVNWVQSVCTIEKRVKAKGAAEC